jgi:hypothetical protein
MLRARRSTQVEEAPDVYSLPEWQRTEAASRMLGHAPSDMSMDMVAKDNPEWYDLPDWMRTDALVAMRTPQNKAAKPDTAEGAPTPAEKRTKAQQAMFYAQSRK